MMTICVKCFRMLRLALMRIACLQVVLIRLQKALYLQILMECLFQHFAKSCGKCTVCLDLIAPCSQAIEFCD